MQETIWAADWLPNVGLNHVRHLFIHRLADHRSHHRLDRRKGMDWPRLRLARKYSGGHCGLHRWGSYLRRIFWHIRHRRLDYFHPGGHCAADYCGIYQEIGKKRRKLTSNISLRESAPDHPCCPFWIPLAAVLRSWIHSSGLHPAGRSGREHEK